MLKFTNVQLDFFTDYDTYLFIEKGIRDEIACCVK